MPGFQSGIALKKAALPPYAGSGCSICPLPPLAARGFFIASHNPLRLTFAPVSSTSPGDFIYAVPRSYPRRPPHFRSGFILIARGFHPHRPGVSFTSPGDFIYAAPAAPLRIFLSAHPIPHIAAANFTPSAAALVIPPAYPAPSPAGYTPWMLLI